MDVWEDIRTAVKEKRINYLQEISKDTLDCIECNKGESKVAKEEFFINYLEQMEQLDTKEYSVYAEKYEEVVGFNTRYRINYAFNKDRKMEGYNSIYTILKGENGIQFQGVFSVP